MASVIVDVVRISGLPAIGVHCPAHAGTEGCVLAPSSPCTRTRLPSRTRGPRLDGAHGSTINGCSIATATRAHGSAAPAATTMHSAIHVLGIRRAVDMTHDRRARRIT